MLRRGDGEAGRAAPVVFSGHDQARDGVRPQKVHQVGTGPGARALHARNAAEPEVVQLEAQAAYVARLG